MFPNVKALMADDELWNKAIDEGGAAFDEMLEKFKNPFSHISEVKTDDLQVDVLECGFPSLDEYMWLKQGEGELHIVGARPSMGKSSFMLQTAFNVAKKGNVYYFSLEDSVQNIMRRLIAVVSEISITSIQKGTAKVEDIDRAMRAIVTRKLYPYEHGRIDLEVMKNSLARVAQQEKYKPTAIFIDYLGLIPRPKGHSTDSEIGAITGELKKLAQVHKCPVVVGCQLNRQPEVRYKNEGKDGHIPLLSDLRDSGNIEQDADTVLFISREEQLKHGMREGEADIKVAKNRNGKTGLAIFRFKKECTKFIDPEEVFA